MYDSIFNSFLNVSNKKGGLAVAITVLIPFCWSCLIESIVVVGSFFFRSSNVSSISKNTIFFPKLIHLLYYLFNNTSLTYLYYLVIEQLSEQMTRFYILYHLFISIFTNTYYTRDKMVWIGRSFSLF